MVALGQVGRFRRGRADSRLRRYDLEHISGDPKILKLISYAPMGWIKRLFQFLRKKSLRTGRYPSTGSISNLGRIQMELLQGGGFETRTTFFIPPGTEAKPFFMTLADCRDSVEMVVSMPKGLANNGRLDRFISNLISALKPR